jgi:hypothetical protein
LFVPANVKRETGIGTGVPGRLTDRSYIMSRKKKKKKKKTSLIPCRIKDNKFYAT